MYCDSRSHAKVSPADAFEKYMNATGSVPDFATGLLSITPAQYSKLMTLTFKVGATSYDLTPNGQIWPRALNTFIPGGSSDKVYLIVADIGSPSGSGLDFTIGYTFLRVHHFPFLPERLLISRSMTF